MARIGYGVVCIHSPPCYMNGGVDEVQELRKSSEWLLWTLVVSLAQLWYDLATYSFTNGWKIDWYEQLQPGILLFVVLATTIGIAVDFHLDDTKSTKPSFLKRVFFLFIPAIVLGFVFWAYSATRGSVTSEQEETFVVLNLCALFLSVIYAIGAKSYLYRRESWI